MTLPAFAAVSRRGPINAGAGSPQNTFLATGRADYTLNARTNITSRYSYQYGDEFPRVTQPYSPDLDKGSQIRNHNAIINVTHVWSSGIVTESRAVFGRVSTFTPEAGPLGLFNTFTMTRENVTLPRGSDSMGGPRNSYQLYQNVNWVRGSHSFTFGAQIDRHRDTQDVSIISEGVRPRFGLFRNFDACCLKQVI